MAERDASSGSPSGSPPFENKPPYGEKEDGNRNIVMRILDSFKRDPARDPTPRGSVGEDGRAFDIELAAAATAMSPLARRLKGRHLQMIAIGGSIGECTLCYRCVLKGCRDLN
jgi:yeast amino acid transporter